MSNMTKTPSLLRHLLFTLLLLCAALVQAAEEDAIIKMDRIIAFVDQAVITENELADRIQTVRSQIEKQGTSAPPNDVLQRQVLERLINDRLLLQYAAQTGIRVDDTQLDKTVERIAEQNQLKMPEFRAALEQEGINYRRFREDIRNEITIARLREREVENRVHVTEAEIDNYLTTQSSQGEIPDEFEISHILIRTPENSAPEELQELRAKAEQALAALQSGANFAQISASVSNAPNALEGGSLGWKSTAQLPDLFNEALKPMHPGELSPILRSPNGFHILKLTDRRGGSSPLVVEQTNLRHILIKLSEIVSESDARQKADMLKERLDNGADFADLARQYSDDASANNGGDLGWVNPGDTVPQFEEAMNQLAPNEISAPVRTSFGWHIIQVLDRRKQDMTREAARFKARQEIRERKADEAYEDWLRELRDRAYVKLQLDDQY